MYRVTVQPQFANKSHQHQDLMKWSLTPSPTSSLSKVLQFPTPNTQTEGKMRLLPSLSQLSRTLLAVPVFLCCHSPWGTAAGPTPASVQSCWWGRLLAQDHVWAHVDGWRLRNLGQPWAQKGPLGLSLAISFLWKIVQWLQFFLPWSHPGVPPSPVTAEPSQLLKCT